MTRWRTRHRGSHAERGAAAVEFAIVLVVLLLIIFAIIDFGRLLFASQSVKAASREGARTAAVRTAWGPVTTAGTVSRVTRDAGSAGAALAGGTLTYSGVSSVGPFNQDSAVTTPLCNAANAAAGQSVQVTVTSTFRWFTPVGIFSSNINSVTASTTMRCE